MNDLWQNFVASGSVADYLKYKQNEKQINSWLYDDGSDLDFMSIPYDWDDNYYW